MRRRELLSFGLGSALATLHAAHAQQKAMPVIGLLGATSPGPNASLVATFRQGLSETGLVDGQSVAIEYRWAEGDYDRLPALATDLVSRKVDVIAIEGGPPSALAAKSATSTIPIVFVVDDPVAVGLVASLARPGGNLTGLGLMNSELVPKRLELLRELVPQAGVIAVLVNPGNANAEPIVRGAQAAASAKGVRLPILKAGTEGEIDAAFAALVQLHADALLIGDDPFLQSRREQLVMLAARDAVPATYGRREFALVGGLMSFGSSLTGVYRRAGVYVGRILNGEKPADLPVERPTKFELVINLKTANALGLTVPPTVLELADEVIE
jgi:putative tryptophan/tyrosine transport system substrate-binding protein